MKRMLVVLLALAVIFSFGTANAAKISKDDQKNISAAIGLYTIWWPTAIDITIPASGQDVTWMLVISNFYLDAIAISVTATAADSAQTTKTFTVPGVGKIFLFPSDFGFFNTVADLWLTSNQAIFGGTLYLMNGNNFSVITTVPHIELENIQ
jgi:hypothetical protein